MNDPKAPRFSRQRRLAEIGDAGQVLLCASEVSVAATGTVAAVEREYLARAGVQVVPASNCRDRDEVEFEHRGWFRFEHSAEVGEGAWRALKQIVRVLEEGAGP